MGRTGKFWACEHAGVVPDLMAVAKGFGGGVMGAGACIGTRDVMEPLFENPFIHTTTFGGNPLACTAAIAAMHVTVTENLPANAQAKGDWLLAKLNDLKARYPHIIKEARGRGLMIGLEFHSDEIGYSFSKAVMSRGILLSGTLIAARVLRVEPPLTITQEEVEIVAERFEASLLAMTQSGIASAPENVPASLKAAGLYNSNPGGAFAIKCAEGYTLSAAAHINPTANPLAAPAVLSIGHGGPGLSPREAHISSPKNGGPHHAFPSAHVGVHVHHHHHHHQAAAAAAAAPVPVVAAPTAAVSAPAPTAAVPAAVAVAAPAPVEEEEDDEVGNVEHQLARQRRNKSSKNKHHGTSSAARSAPNSGSKDSKDEAKLAALRELEGGGSVGETSAAMAAPAASPRHGHHHHRRHHRPHPATGAASAASAAAGPLFLDGEAGDGKDEEKRRTSSMTSNDSAAHPGPILMGHEGGAAGVAAPGGGGGAASGAGRHSAAATSSRSAHEADDEAEDDDEEEDDEDDEDESDVSSVSSTSTESVSGMSSEDDE
jgi:Aminotransferase class-III